MNWWHYLLLVNIYLVLFYGFYALLLRKETFFQLNRIYLVSASLLSFIIPVIQADWVKNLFITEEVHYSIYGQSAINIYSLHPVQSSPVTVGQVLLALYIAGITVLTLRFMVQLIRVNKLLKTPEPSAAYAFFNKINLGEKVLDHKAVLAHEQVHAKQLHSLDVLLIETVMIINWFNPIVYLYRFAIKHIHEYIADQQVIKIGADKAEYAMLLVSQTFSAPSHGLISAFTGSLLKKRIVMLQKDRSKRIVLIKYVLSAPLFGLMLILSSATIDDNKAINLIQNHATVLFDKSAKSIISGSSANNLDLIDNHSEITADAAQDGKIYETVDTQPQYPGGMDGFSRFLAGNIHYPTRAREKNIQGRVYVQFIIETNGAVTNVKAVKEPSADLGAEAVRVIKTSRRWKPGLVAGKRVRTSYTVPVNFNLETADVMLAPPPAAPKKVTTVTIAAPDAPMTHAADKVYEAVETEPTFVGGQDAFNRFLSNTVKYPAVDREKNIAGKVYVSFVVEADGSLSNVHAVRGPSETEMAEAVRGVSLSPKWNPGVQNGRPVRVNYTVPVNFTLSKDQVAASLKPGGEKVYEAVEQEPEFPGGQEAFNRFLAGIVKYPAADRNNKVTGKVYVAFVVEKDGSLSEVKGVRGPSETTIAEAVRAISLSPKWHPGIQNGQPVRVSYTVPVNFLLYMDKEEITATLKAYSETQALVIVNDKEYTKPLNSISVNDILSINVLKSEAAIKRYGEKAKNGAIEIKLK